MIPTFEIFVDKVGQHRFHLRAANGETVLQSEGYTSYQACRDTISAIQTIAATAKVKVLSSKK